MLTVASMMEPTVQVTEQTTLGDIERWIRRDDPGFLQLDGRWYALVPQQLMAVPRSRRVIDLPMIPVTPVDPRADLLALLPGFEGSSVACSPVVEDGRLVGRLVHDRARLEASLAEGDLLAELSTLREATRLILHDLSNVVAVGMMGSEDPMVEQAMEHARALIGRLRALHGGGEDASATTTDLAHALRATAPVLDGLVRHSVRVEIEAPDEEIHARCAPSLVDRTLLNLVLNAAEAGATRITVRAGHAGDRVFLAVHDDGAGIDAGLLPRVFDRGYTTKSDHQGLGLYGLRRAARRAGGDLEVETNPGAGSTFTLWLDPARGQST